MIDYYTSEIHIKRIGLREEHEIYVSVWFLKEKKMVLNETSAVGGWSRFCEWLIEIKFIISSCYKSHLLRIERFAFKCKATKPSSNQHLKTIISLFCIFFIHRCLILFISPLKKRGSMIEIEHSLTFLNALAI